MDHLTIAVPRVSRYDHHMDTNAIIRKGPGRQDWYVVAHAVDLTVAEIPAGLLRSAGIPVYLFREAVSSSALPLTIGPLAGVDIAVPKAYYEEAKALLEDDENEGEADKELDSGDESGDHESEDEDV
jgi:hypothetical protein